MSVINCSNCGNIFRSIGTNICPDCQRNVDAGFEKIRRYLEENPKSTINEIADGTDLSEDVVLKFVNAGRLMAGGSMTSQCEICGKMVSKGRICGSCAGALGGR